MGRLEQALRFAIDLNGEDIPYSRCDAYSQVLHEVQYALDDLASGGHLESAAWLCRASRTVSKALDMGRSSFWKAAFALILATL